MLIKQRQFLNFLANYTLLYSDVTWVAHIQLAKTVKCAPVLCYFSLISDILNALTRQVTKLINYYYIELDNKPSMHPPFMTLT